MCYPSVGWCIIEYVLLIGKSSPHSGRKEGNILFNDALNTFYLRVIWRQA